MKISSVVLTKEGRDGREAATSPGTEAWSPQKLGEVRWTLL